MARVDFSPHHQLCHLVPHPPPCYYAFALLPQHDVFLHIISFLLNHESNSCYVQCEICLISQQLQDEV